MVFRGVWLSWLKRYLDMVEIVDSSSTTPTKQKKRTVFHGVLFVFAYRLLFITLYLRRIRIKIAT